MTPEERQELKELRDIVDRLLAGEDPNFIEAIRNFAFDTALSTKSAASATRSVDEAGALTYNVMYAPDGFIKIGGRNVPYIN